MSAAPPGAKVLTILTGRDGQSSAPAGVDAPAAAATSTANIATKRFIGKNPQLTRWRPQSYTGFSGMGKRIQRRDERQNGLVPNPSSIDRFDLSQTGVPTF
jgi:hypothetical protein